MNIYKANNLSKFDRIRHGFFDRMGGYSTGSFESLNVGLNRGDDNAVRNREKIAKHFGVESTNLITAQQVHSTTIHLITRENIDQYRNSDVPCDGLVTNIPGLLIGVYTADCVPLLMYDNEAGYIAVIHCGWHGAFKGMLSVALQYMRALGCNNLHIATGAFIHTFEIDPTLVPIEYRGFLRLEQSEHGIYDFRSLVHARIANVDYEDLNINTYSNENFFSYRRFTQLQMEKGISGRNGVQLSCIMIKDKKI